MRHNPFAPSPPKHKAKKAKSTSGDAAKTESTTTADAPASSGGGTSGPTTPTAPAAPTTTVPAGSIVVRFGADGGELPRKTLQRNEALEDSDGPILVFTGLKNNGKTAVFMVREGLKADGDGTCKPKVSCETIELQVGETEFFSYEGDVDGTQFELDLVKIYKHDTKVPATGEDSSSSTGFGTGSGSSSGGASTASLKTRRLH
jgi:hypothetical protein